MRSTPLPSPGEFVLLGLAIVGALTVLAFLVSAVVQAGQVLLSGAAIDQLRAGLPWLLAGVTLGVAISIVAAEPAREVDP